MKKNLTAIILAVLMIGVGSTLAQTTTPVSTPTGPQSSVQAFFVVCDNRAIINLSGTMVGSDDVFFQIFNGAGGTGTALTGVRQAQVSGTYAVSDTVNYNSGSTVGTGSFGSMRLYITTSAARVSDTTLVATIDDVQDGCSAPQNTVSASIDVGGGDTAAAPSAAATPSGILTPFGTVLNQNVVEEGIVFLGARPSVIGGTGTRSNNPGLVFAECDQYPQADPGTVFDTDNVMIYWSWFAKDTDRLVEHLQNAVYSVSMNNAPLPNGNRTEPQTINRDEWVFYTVQIGNLRPGRYDVSFQLDWQNAISDGYAEFGPGTSTPQIIGSCSFQVVDDPGADTPAHTGMFNPR